MRTMEQIIPEGMDIEEFLVRCRTDFKFWCEKVIQIPHDHSKTLIIKDFHMEWFHAFYTKRRSAIEASRGSGKSHLLGVAFPLWIIFFNQYKEFMITSDTLPQATGLLERIVLTIKENELLQNLIPKKFDLSWSKTEINTSTRCKIFCKPYTKAILSVHVDFVLCDEASKYRDKNIYYRTITPTVNQKDGHIMLIGTPESPTDLLAELSENKEYFFKVYPIINKEGKSIFPEKFSLDKLKHIRDELDLISYNREYLCVLTSDRMSLVPIEILVPNFDIEASFEVVPEEKAVYLMSGDLAMSTKGDYSVFTVVKQIEDKFEIVYIRRPQRGLHPRAQHDIIEEIYKIYKPRQILIDEGTFGKNFLVDLRAKGLPVKGFHFTRETKIELIMNMVSLLESRRLKIPRKVDESLCKSLTDIYIEEANGLIQSTSPSGQTIIKSTTKHDDVAISVALACYLGRRMGTFQDIVVTGSSLKQPETQVTSEIKEVKSNEVIEKVPEAKRQKILT